MLFFFKFLLFYLCVKQDIFLTVHHNSLWHVVNRYHITCSYNNFPFSSSEVLLLQDKQKMSHPTYLETVIKAKRYD